VCRCRSLVKELVKLRYVEPNCLDARVELEKNDDENQVNAKIVIHIAKKGNTLTEFRDYPVAVLWLSFQGLENYPNVKISEYFVHVASLGSDAKFTSERMDMEKLVVGKLEKVETGAGYLLRLHEAAWSVLQQKNIKV